MASRDLRGKVAIVGASETDKLGTLPEHSVLQLHAEAARNALDDAGLKLSDVDGLFAAGITSGELGAHLGLVPRYTDGTSVGGCSFLIHVEHAMLALDAGLIDVALIAHGESGRSRIGTAPYAFSPSAPGGQFEAPYGMTGAGNQFSFLANRHMHEYGTTREQMAALSVAQRKWAAMHPKAVMRDPITIDDVINSRMITWPFSLLMCCLVTDAGGALVLTRADRAKDLRKPPVYVLGTGEATAHFLVSQMPDMTTSEANRASGKAAFEMAGVSRSDIDVAELYDAFAFTPMLALEDLGFVGPGESGPFVASGAVEPGGDFPLNTNGGGMSYSHSGMYGMYTMIELVRQLRGEAGERQVADANVGLAHGIGGMIFAAGTLIAANAAP